MEETKRRRDIQLAYNKKNGIIPQTIVKSISEEQTIVLNEVKHLPRAEIPKRIAELDLEMRKAADDLQFELAIELRDQINQLKKELER